jgi:hypothetical protein
VLLVTVVMLVVVWRRFQDFQDQSEIVRLRCTKTADRHEQRENRKVNETSVHG